MINPTDNTIIIVGPSGTGKTPLTDKLAAEHPDYKVYRSDDFMKFGFEKSVYALAATIDLDKARKIIVEGVQGARLLRLWARAEVNPFGATVSPRKADLVIFTEGTPPQEKNTGAHQAQGKGIDTVTAEWSQIRSYEPRILYNDEQGFYTRSKRQSENTGL